MNWKEETKTKNEVLNLQNAVETAISKLPENTGFTLGLRLARQLDVLTKLKTSILEEIEVARKAVLPKGDVAEDYFETHPKKKATLQSAINDLGEETVSVRILSEKLGEDLFPKEVDPKVIALLIDFIEE